MSLLDRLPPEFRRRYYVNVALLIAIVLFFTNVGRLGKHNTTIAIFGFLELALLYLCIWPFVKLLQAEPKPPRVAFFVVATWVLAFAYVAVSGFAHLAGSGIALVIGWPIMIVSFIAYRKYLFPKLGERISAVRAAQLAEKFDRRS